MEQTAFNLDNHMNCVAPQSEDKLARCETFPFLRTSLNYLVNQILKDTR